MTPRALALGNPASKGFTMVEIMISSACLLIMILLFAPTLRVSIEGSTHFEAKNAIKTAAQAAINRIGGSLVESRRIFGRGLLDSEYLSRIELGPQPAPIVDSTAPVKFSGGSLAPGDDYFDASRVGNLIFLASSESPYLTSARRLDVYRFHFYYLGKGDLGAIGKQFNRNLWEWHSESYVDFSQVNEIIDPLERATVYSGLRKRGITHAWDISEADPSHAFYLLDDAGGPLSQPDHRIPRKDGKPMIEILTGISLGSYRYGVSPNTGAEFETRASVPKFASPSGSFPSGFEVQVVGPTAKRQVFIRLVLAAEGSFPQPIVNEQVLLMTAMDAW